MPYFWLATRVALHSFFDLTISLGRALMLTQVFRPRIDYEGFEITILNFQVSINAPTRSAVAAPDASVFVHGIEKLGSLFRDHVVLCRDQNRTGVISIG